MRQLRTREFTFLLILVIPFIPMFAGAQEPPKVSIFISPGDEIAWDLNGDFIVPQSTRLTWDVRVSIQNTLQSGEYKNLIWHNRYDGALQLDAVDVGRGEISRPGLTEIEWTIDTLKPGNTAELRFRLTTRTTADGVQLYSELDCGLWEHGAELRYQLEGESGSRTWPSRQRCVIEAPPWINVALTTRKDWRLRRPGCFASEAFLIELASNAGVAVSFDEFSDLERLNDPTSPAIPAWYTWGENFADALWAGWIPAADFNNRKWTYSKSPALEAGITERFWNQLCIGPEHAASDYENNGFITITLHAGSTHVEP